MGQTMVRLLEEEEFEPVASYDVEKGSDLTCTTDSSLSTTDESESESEIEDNKKKKKKSQKETRNGEDSFTYEHNPMDPYIVEKKFITGTNTFVYNVIKK